MSLPSQGWLVLDPAVEVVPAKLREFFPIAGSHKIAVVATLDLHHQWLGAIVVAPPGNDFAELFRVLERPVPIEDVWEEFGEGAAPAVEQLVDRGFVHVSDTSQLDLGTLRETWLTRVRQRFPGTLEANLDAAGDPLARLVESPGHDLRLRCRDLDDHRAILQRLVDDSRRGALHVRRVIAAPQRVPDGAICELLFRLGATLEIAGGRWPGPVTGADGLVATVVELEGAWTELTLDAVRRCAASVEAARVTGIRFRPTAGGDDADADAVEQALCALEDAVGDVEVVGLPPDDVIVGHRVAPVDVRDPFTAEIRRRHLLRRAAAIRELEEMLGPPPSTAGDATVIDPADDLVPRHPELLALPANAIVADICCSAGRTSRRLAPLVGREGAIVGIEKELLVLDIGRAIDDAEGVTNVQARRGLAQRLPLPDACADAVVCDWTFNLLLIAGIADVALAEMVRVLKPGGRLAVMQALARFGLSDLANPLVYGKEEGIDVSAGIDAAFARRADALDVVVRKLWLAEDRSAGHPLRWYRRAHLPRLVDPVGDGRVSEGRRATLCYSIIAAKRSR